MRKIDEQLRNHLALEASTICTCWIIRRADGQVFGFTDHDNDLTIEGTVCLAASGFQPTEAVSSLGLSVDSQEIEGVILSDVIAESDLAAGRYDDARVEVWMVNWSEPDQRHHLRTSILGEINRQENMFKAELRGITSLLDQKHGRTFLRTCDAILGDGNCQVNLSQPSFVGMGAVAEVLDRRILRADIISYFPEQWFTFGNLEWTSGKNLGLKVEIAGNSSSQADHFQLWKAMPITPEVGDAFIITVGCDKTFATCKSKFANQLNFQGFPHMPGTDFALGYAEKTNVHDGSALVE